MESDAASGSAGVDNEGLAGTSLFLGGTTTPSSAVVHAVGHAYRVERGSLMQEFNRADLMQRLLLRYTQALLTQMAQTAACNRRHTVEQQWCRWLLLILDRLGLETRTCERPAVVKKDGEELESLVALAKKLMATQRKTTVLLPCTRTRSSKW
jgi:hypothetical protein